MIGFNIILDGDQSRMATNVKYICFSLYIQMSFLGVSPVLRQCFWSSKCSVFLS